MPLDFSYEIDTTHLPEGIKLHTDFVVAPEAVRPDGRSYELIYGSLDKIPELPFAIREALVSVSKNSSNLGSKTFWHRDSVRCQRKELVKGLLPKIGVGLIAGQSGSGKTFLSLHLAACAALGYPFFDRRVSQKVGTFLALGEGIDTITERLEAIMQSDLVALSDTPPERLPIACYPLDKPIAEENEKTSLVEEIRHAGQVFSTRYNIPLGIVIIDTLAAAFPEDENDATAATHIMQYLQRISLETGALVLAITHYGKNADAGVRGSSAFTASADVILAVHCEKNSKGEVSSRTVHLTKSRWREIGWSGSFKLMPVAIGTNEEGEIATSSYISAEYLQDKNPAKKRYTNALSILLQAFDKATTRYGEEICLRDSSKVISVRRDVLKNEFYALYPSDSDTETKRTDNKRKQFKRAFDTAISEGLLSFDFIKGAEWTWRQTGDL